MAEKAFIPNDEVELLLNELTGWLEITIRQRMAAGQSACVSRKELKLHIAPFLEKMRSRKLIDYAVSQIPNDDELSRRAGERPVYVRQLSHINLTDDRIIEAVSDYFRAATNRLEWIEKGLVDEKDMKDFESKLETFHKNEQLNVELTQSSLSEENRGQVLFVNCQKRQERIADKEPPDKTVQGSYHVLADEQLLGWHPHT